MPMASSLKEAVSSLKKKISGTFPKALKEEYVEADLNYYVEENQE